MTASTASEAEIIREMSAIVGRDLKPRAAVYWTDLALSAGGAYAATAAFLVAPRVGLPFGVQALCGALAGLALFRLGTFIHEIQHLRRGELAGFKVAWNLLYGIPFLMPSFMYANHSDHHSLRKYGTAQDGEYLPLATGTRSALAIYFLEIPLLPLLAVLRFALLVPVSLVSRRARRWLMERASSYGINLRYRREVRDDELYGWTAWADALGMAVVYGVLALLASGVLPWEAVLRLYAVAGLSLGLNWVRTLFAHRYRRNGEPGGRIDQLADSITLTGNAFGTELLFPVGLRYHSLHHLFPTLPYHALGRAHRRLMLELPDTAPYKATVVPNVREAWRSFMRDLRSAGKAPSPQAIVRS
jgi:fatty acid desaturase